MQLVMNNEGLVVMSEFSLMRMTLNFIILFI